MKETIDEFYGRIVGKAEGIVKNVNIDGKTTNMEEMNSKIDMLRELRTEIKDAAGKYTDEDSRSKLGKALIYVINVLEEMKHVRGLMGWATIGFGEATDPDENKEIMAKLGLKKY